MQLLPLISYPLAHNRMWEMLPTTTEEALASLFPSVVISPTKVIVVEDWPVTITQGMLEIVFGLPFHLIEFAFSPRLVSVIDVVSFQTRLNYLKEWNRKTVDKLITKEIVEFMNSKGNYEEGEFFKEVREVFGVTPELIYQIARKEVHNRFLEKSNLKYVIRLKVFETWLELCNQGQKINLKITKRC